VLPPAPDLDPVQPPFPLRLPPPAVCCDPPQSGPPSCQTALAYVPALGQAPGTEPAVDRQPLVHGQVQSGRPHGTWRQVRNVGGDVPPVLTCPRYYPAGTSRNLPPARADWRASTTPSHPRRTVEAMASPSEGRVIAVIGTCSAGGCSRPAVRHVELFTAGRRVAGIVCDRCAVATSSALFLLDLIA
jgi:hypothetical protein